MSEGVSEWVSARGIECLTENERVKKSVIQSVGGRMCAWADWLANWVSEWVSMRDWVLEWKSVSHSVGGWANVCVGEQASEWLTDWLTERVGEIGVGGWVSERVITWASAWASEWAIERVSRSDWECVGECASEQVSARVSELTSCCLSSPSSLNSGSVRCVKRPPANLKASRIRWYVLTGCFCRSSGLNLYPLE